MPLSHQAQEVFLRLAADAPLAKEDVPSLVDIVHQNCLPPTRHDVFSFLLTRELTEWQLHAVASRREVTGNPALFALAALHPRMAQRPALQYFSRYRYLLPELRRYLGENHSAAENLPRRLRYLIVAELFGDRDLLAPFVLAVGQDLADSSWELFIRLVEDGPLSGNLGVARSQLARFASLATLA